MGLFQRQAREASAARGDLRSAETRLADDGLNARTTSSLGVWPWAKLALRNGISLERFCELGGIEVAELRDAGMRFSQRTCNRIAELALAQFGPDAAMQAALTIEPGQFNLLEVIARSAETAAAGLETGCQFFALLHNGGRLRYERLAQDAVALSWRPPSYTVHHGFVELTFAVAVIGVRRETGHAELVPEEICFSHGAPADSAGHAAVLGAAPQFAAGEDLLVFPREVAALPLLRASAAVHAAAVRTGAELLED